MVINYWLLSLYLVGVAISVTYSLFKDPLSSKITRTVSIIHLVWIVFTVVQLYLHLF